MKRSNSFFFLSRKTSNSKDSIIWIGYTYSSMLSSLSLVHCPMKLRHLLIVIVNFEPRENKFLKITIGGYNLLQSKLINF